MKLKLLTARDVATKPEGFHADGGNLFLRVRGDSRVWIFRYKTAGKQKSIGLGATHSRPLAEARDLATQLRNAIVNGKDPSSEYKKMIHPTPTTVTFKAYALALIAAKQPSWRNKKHAQQWLNTLTQYAFPYVGNKSLSSITLEDIKAILLPIWQTKTETASRLRMRIEAVLDYAIVHEQSDRRNPARWKNNLSMILPSPRKIKKAIHLAAAAYQDVPRIMAELRNKDSLSAHCLRFLILTAARSGEARGALWSEIDLAQKVWRISSERMKAKREHAVPLCDEAIAIIQKVTEWKTQHAERVFQGSRGGLLSDVAINKLLHSIAPTVTVHGFRSSFRIWGAETTSTPSAVLELALAHVNQNKVEAAYQRSDLFEHRRELMRLWGDYCDDSKKNIIK